MQDINGKREPLGHEYLPHFPLRPAFLITFGIVASEVISILCLRGSNPTTFAMFAVAFPLLALPISSSSLSLAAALNRTTFGLVVFVVIVLTLANWYLYQIIQQSA